MQQQNNANVNEHKRKSEINMMMSVEDFQDTGFSKIDFAVRVDVPYKRNNNKDVKIIQDGLIQSCKTKRQRNGQYDQI